jgi:hypothetical protein
LTDIPQTGPDDELLVGLSGAYRPVAPLLQIVDATGHVYIANGDWRSGDQSVEFLCAAIEANEPDEGTLRRATPALTSSVALQPSETEGGRTFVEAGCLHNLPEAIENYVARSELDDELASALGEPAKRHMVNVRGTGGMGKTSAVLHACQQLAADDRACPYFHIVWISARDVDLTMAGPVKVAQDAETLTDVLDNFHYLVDPENEAPSQHVFETTMQDTVPTLLVVDNFETLADQDDAYKYFDHAVRPPSKVVITSRHEFSGNFRIDVTGMRVEEARALIRHSAASVAGVHLSEQDVSDIYTACHGHPYAMKLAATQGAAPRIDRQLFTFVPQIEDVLEQLFRSSLDHLYRAKDGIGDDATFVFLLLSEFSEGLSEVAVAVAAARHGVAWDRAATNLLSVSLIDHDRSRDRLDMPAMAREFAQHRFKRGHTLTTSIVEAAAFIRRWPGLGEGDTYPAGHALAKALKAAPPEERPEMLEALRVLAHYDGQLWVECARAARAIGSPRAEWEEYYKWAVEYDPSNPVTYAEWAEALPNRAGTTKVELHVQALTISPDLDRASTVARMLNGLHRRQPELFTPARWRAFMRPVADALESYFTELGSEEAQHLAYLYENMGDVVHAKSVIQRAISTLGAQRRLVRHHEKLASLARPT